MKISLKVTLILIFFFYRISEVCLAIFEDDNRWYRCVCLGNASIETCQLAFLDYGNVAFVHVKNIRRITKEFLHPYIANTCYIISGEFFFLILLFIKDMT